MTVPLLPPPPALARRLAGTPLLAMLDVDGTLAPIAPRPELAAVPEATRVAVGALARAAGVHVAIVSGRGAADARRMIGEGPFWIVGNHGMETVAPDGTLRVDDRVAPFRGAVADAGRRLGEALRDTEGALVEDKLLTLSVHFRLVAAADAPRLQQLAAAEAKRAGLEITQGKQVLELRPPVRIDKGTAVRDLAVELGGAGDGSSLLYVGDDRTDEDAFVALRRAQPAAVTVHVGAPELADGSQTRAEFLVYDTDDVRALLEWLVTVR